jgi:hypothetical protein
MKEIGVGRLRRGSIVLPGIVLGVMVFAFLYLLTTGQALMVSMVVLVVGGTASLLHRASSVRAESTMSSGS